MVLQVNIFSGISESNILYNRDLFLLFIALNGILILHVKLIPSFDFGLTWTL